MTDEADSAASTHELHSAAVHSDYVAQRAYEALLGTEQHRDGLASRHAREMAAADDQVAEAERQAGAAADERAAAYAAIGLDPPELPGTDAAAGTAGAKGSA